MGIINKNNKISTEYNNLATTNQQKATPTTASATTNDSNSKNNKNIIKMQAKWNDILMSHNEDYNDICGSGNGSNNDNTVNDNNKILTEYNNLATNPKSSTNSKNNKSVEKIQAKWKHITNQIKTQ